ncbi:hypothetical protein POTOM_061264 [Populus tomentosa]|uniref:DUF4283 domain-containing protein n=1 Tax=Populus tomentosa TaxID=118781 RepID=A0A8X8BZU8_POPTO|nr:hypothetical protein POTOM_061264 [Populus tomentosa]
MRKGHLTELPKMNQTLVQLRDERTYIDMIRTPNSYRIVEKWIGVGLPLAMWNKDFISNILAAQGKLIGYDLNNVGHNYISGVHHTPESESEEEDDIMSLHNSARLAVNSTLSQAADMNKSLDLFMWIIEFKGKGEPPTGASNFSNLARYYEPFSWLQTSHGSAE